MVGYSNRSPSPLSQTQQNQSTTKTSNATRPAHLNTPKKFNFLTPSNTPSPSEIGLRNWVGGEEKENEKAQFLKLRSPSNGSKSFMAPTISAASKFTPSPRKKILVDRNDPVRTSIILSNGKPTFFSSLTSDFDTKPAKNNEALVSSQRMKAAPEVPTHPKPLRKVTFKEVTTFNPHNLAESTIQKVSTNSDLEHNPDHPSVELSNINLSCPPYQPSSKILSSQRIDVVKINFDGSGSDESKQLEDSCMCELSENLSFLEGLEQSETGDSWEKLEDVSSISQFAPLVSESLPATTPIADVIAEDSYVPKPKTKPRPLLRNWKSVCFFLVLLGTLMLSATNFPAMHSLVPKDLNFEFSELSPVAEIAKVNFDEFTGKVKQRWADSISYLYKVVIPVLEVEKMGPLQFMNFTLLEDGYRINGFFGKYKGFEEGLGLELEEVEDEEGGDETIQVNDAMKEDELEIEEFEDDMEEVEDEMKEVEETCSSFDSTVHMVSAPEAPDTELKIDTSQDYHYSAETDKSHEENEAGSSVASIKLGHQGKYTDMVSIPESLDTPHPKLHASEIDYDSSSAEIEILVEEKKPSKLVESKQIVGNQESFLDVGFIDESSQIPKGPESSFEESRIEARIVILGTSLLLLGIGTVAVTIYLEQLSKKASSRVVTTPIFSNKINFLQQEQPSIEDMIGESCASEMSSCRRSSSSNQKQKNTKRESLVYSSEYSFGSPSYGSFTTYETISLKHGDRDEEIMTPVRRSSRIRKHVTAQ